MQNLPYSLLFPTSLLPRKKQMSKDTAVFASYMLKRWGDIYYSEYYILSSSVYFEYCIPFTEAEKGWGFS